MGKYPATLRQDFLEHRLVIAGNAITAFGTLALMATIEYPIFTDAEITKEGFWN